MCVSHKPAHVTREAECACADESRGVIECFMTRDSDRSKPGSVHVKTPSKELYILTHLMTIQCLV